MEPFLIGTVVIVVLAGMAAVISAIKVVREYQRLVVFRLGRVIGTKGPGLVILIPLVDRATMVDLREFYLEIPHQTAITEDNASISIDFIVFNKVLDAQMSVVDRRELRRAPRRTSPRRPCGRWWATCRSTTCWPSASR